MSNMAQVEMREAGDPTVRLFILNDAFATVSPGYEEDVEAKSAGFTDSVIASDIAFLVPGVEKVRVTSIDGRDALAVRLQQGNSWNKNVRCPTGETGTYQNIVKGMFEKRIVPGLTGAHLPQVGHDFNKVSDKDIKKIFQAILPTVMLSHKGTAAVKKIDRGTGNIDVKMGGNCPSCAFGSIARGNTERKIRSSVEKYLGMEVNFT